MKRLWGWLQHTFGIPNDTQLGYSVPVGVQVEPISEANFGGIGNTCEGSGEAFCPGFYEAFGFGMTTDEWESKYGNNANNKENTNG